MFFCPCHGFVNSVYILGQTILAKLVFTSQANGARYLLVWDEIHKSQERTTIAQNFPLHTLRLRCSFLQAYQNKKTAKITGGTAASGYQLKHTSSNERDCLQPSFLPTYMLKVADNNTQLQIKIELPLAFLMFCSSNLQKLRPSCKNAHCWDTACSKVIQENI